MNIPSTIALDARMQYTRPPCVTIETSEVCIACCAAHALFLPPNLVPVIVPVHPTPIAFLPCDLKVLIQDLISPQFWSSSGPISHASANRPLSGWYLRFSRLPCCGKIAFVWS